MGISKSFLNILAASDITSFPLVLVTPYSIYFPLASLVFLSFFPQALCSLPRCFLGIFVGLVCLLYTVSSIKSKWLTKVWMILLLFSHFFIFGAQVLKLILKSSLTSMSTPGFHICVPSA